MLSSISLLRYAVAGLLCLAALGTARAQSTSDSESGVRIEPDAMAANVAPLPPFVQWLRSGFYGSEERHKAQTGFHYRVGFGTVQALQTSYSTFRVDMHYNHSRKVPLNIEWGASFGDYLSTNIGAYLNFFFTPRFTLDYGMGYEFVERIPMKPNSDQYVRLSQPYFKVGLTYMFNTKSWGGLSYYYMRGIQGSAMRISSHNIVYVVGQTSSLWFTLAIGLGIYEGLIL